MIIGIICLLIIIFDLVILSEFLNEDIDDE